VQRRQSDSRRPTNLARASWGRRVSRGHENLPSLLDASVRLSSEAADISTTAEEAYKSLCRMRVERRLTPEDVAQHCPGAPPDHAVWWRAEHTVCPFRGCLPVLSA